MLRIYHDQSRALRFFKHFIGSLVACFVVLYLITLLSGQLSINFDNLLVLGVACNMSATMIFRAIRPKVQISGGEIKLEQFYIRRKAPISSLQSVVHSFGFFVSTVQFDFSTGKTKFAVLLSKRSAKEVMAWWESQNKPTVHH